MRLRAWFAVAALALASFAAQAATPAAAPVLGRDYIEIPGGQPFAPAPGKIEVAEVFGYVCPHCAHFESQLAAWQRRQPADVALTRVPAPFGGYWLPYARAYFAAERLGVVGKTHQALFDALHVNGTLPIQNVSIDELATFYAGYGVKPDVFSAAIRSAEVDAQIKHAEDFLTKSDTDSTPSLIVAGRYKVVGAKSYDELLRIADALVAMERAKRRGGKAK